MKLKLINRQILVLMTQAICAYEKVQDIQADKIDDENELR